LEKRSRRQARFHHTSSRYSTLLQQQLTQLKSVIALIICITPVLLGFIIPTGFLFDMALDTYSQVLNKDFYLLLLNSLGLAFVTAIFALLIALFMAYSNRNTQS
ncbi:MAG: iron ABC transporter permease, partial [Gammaproteobacteria bacterium]